MAKKTKAYVRHMTTLAKDTVKPPPSLPDAEAVLEMGFDLTPNEITVIRMAMAINSASRKPQLLWSGWKHIAVACAIGSQRAQQKAKTTNLKDYQYRMLMGEFLRKTGLIFVNKYDRSCAVRMLDFWEDVEAWRTSLSESRRRALNNPTDIWREYHGDMTARPDGSVAWTPRTGGKKRAFPSMLEQMEALAEALQAAEEQRDRAEQEADFFKEMMEETAIRAKFSANEVADIRAKVRANREPLVEEEPDDDDTPI
jgi:hypothetical protein